MKLLLNAIGVLIFFLVRLAGRKDKGSPLSITFWLKDNWEQLITVLLFDIGLMILLGEGGLNISFDKLVWLPEWLQIIGDSASALVIGLFGAWLAYAGYKKAIIDNR